MPVARLKHLLRHRLGAKGGIVHSVGTLVGGTALAQALTVLALPVLTRLFTPAEFSVLAVYAALLGILVVIASLRLEIAIPMPETDEEAASLLALSLLSGWTLSLLLGTLVLLFDGRLATWFHLKGMGPFLWLVPIGVGLASAYAALQWWAIRRKKFPMVARTRVTQAIGGIGVQLGAGVAGFGPVGLLMGHAVSGGAGFLALARGAWKHDRAVLGAVTVGSMRDAWHRYSRFPKYSTWEALANTAGTQVPVILIAAWAAGPEAGYLLLATRLMAAPMALLGGSVAQVYVAHAPDELRAGRLGEFSARILSGLVKTGVGPLLFAAIVAAPLAEVVFGGEWRRAGELIAWMTPWFVLQFLSSPVSMVVHVVGRQRLMMALTLFGGAVRIVALMAASVVLPGALPEVFAISSAMVYLVYCVIFYRLAAVSAQAFTQRVWRHLPVLLGWMLAAIAIRASIAILG